MNFVCSLVGRNFFFWWLQKWKPYNHFSLPNQYNQSFKIIIIYNYMRRRNNDPSQSPSRRHLANAKITVVSAPNQHIAYQKHQIGQKTAIPEKFIPSSEELSLKPIQLTKSHFIDAYSKVRCLNDYSSFSLNY